MFDVAGWPAHRAGQHVDLRLTAADGYQAQRSYSLATPADGERVELGVELIEEGELGWTEAGVPVWASVEQPASRLPDEELSWWMTTTRS